MKKILTIAAAMILFVVSVNAQTYVNAGYGLAWDKVKIGNVASSTDNSNSIFAGVSHNFTLVGDFGVEPGINYLFNFSNRDDDGLGFKNRHHGIMVPVLFNYNFDIAQDFSFKALLGPSLNFGLSDKTTTYVDGVKGYTINNYTENSIRRFGVSASIGLAAEWFDTFRLKIGYDIGLNDLSKDEALKFRQNLLTFTVGYMF